MMMLNKSTWVLALVQLGPLWALFGVTCAYLSFWAFTLSLYGDDGVTTDQGSSYSVYTLTSSYLYTSFGDRYASDYKPDVPYLSSLVLTSSLLPSQAVSMSSRSSSASSSASSALSSALSRASSSSSSYVSSRSSFSASYSSYYSRYGTPPIVVRATASVPQQWARASPVQARKNAPAPTPAPSAALSREISDSTPDVTDIRKRRVRVVSGGSSSSGSSGGSGGGNYDSDPLLGSQLGVSFAVLLMISCLMHIALNLAALIISRTKVNRPVNEQARSIFLLRVFASVSQVLIFVCGLAHIVVIGYFLTIGADPVAILSIVFWIVVLILGGVLQSMLKRDHMQIKQGSRFQENHQQFAVQPGSKVDFQANPANGYASVSPLQYAAANPQQTQQFQPNQQMQYIAVPPQQGQQMQFVPVTTQGQQMQYIPVSPQSQGQQIHYIAVTPQQAQQMQQPVQSQQGSAQSQSNH